MMKKVIVFDLDGTLAESKQPLDGEMAALLSQLIADGCIVAVMSGGSFAQYEHQFLPFLRLSDEQYRQLCLLPTSGAALYQYTSGTWYAAYSRMIPTKDREAIIQTLHDAAAAAGAIPPQTYGEQIEDRGSQVTFSALGQLAPLTEKSAWDPDQTTRKRIVEYFSQRLPQYDVHIGGMTSIDVTEKGIDKTYGIEQLSQHLSIPIKDMVFVGDALYPGGNDEPAKASGIECVSVKSVDNTKGYIRAMLTK